MDCDFPPVLEGQISINELLLEIGEPTIESPTANLQNNDDGDLAFAAPMLPGF